MERLHQTFARIGAPDCAACGRPLNGTGYACWDKVEVTLWHCVNAECRLLWQKVRKETPR